MNRITELVEQTSRTFAIGIRQLPAELRETISVAYLVLRVSDYFEDNEAMLPEEKIGYLNRWADALEAAGEARPASLGLFQGPVEFDEATPDADAARDSAFILEAFSALPVDHRAIVGKHVIASTHGMARWVETGPAFTTESDLDDYMFEVAGRVGLLLTDLFALRCDAVAARRDEMTRLGVDFGLGLQTVNVIRGLSSDPARGWIFLPKEFLPTDTDPAELWREPTSEPALALLDRLVSKARRHLEAAREYTLGIPRREYGLRVFCLLPLLFAVRTVELSRSNPNVYTSEVKLGRDEVKRIALRTRLLAGSNRWVRSAVG